MRPWAAIQLHSCPVAAPLAPAAPFRVPTRTHTLHPWAPRIQVVSALLCSAIPVRQVAGHNLFTELDEADSFFILQEGAWAGSG